MIEDNASPAPLSFHAVWMDEWLRQTGLAELTMCRAALPARETELKAVRGGSPPPPSPKPLSPPPPGPRRWTNQLALSDKALPQATCC